jgi:hypothetical protein
LEAAYDHASDQRRGRKIIVEPAASQDFTYDEEPADAEAIPEGIQVDRGARDRGARVQAEGGRSGIHGRPLV